MICTRLPTWQAVGGGIQGTDVCRDDVRQRAPVEARGVGLLMDVSALGQRCGKKSDSNSIIVGGDHG